MPSVSLREFKNGAWLEQEDPRLASSIKKLAWMQDGMDDSESEALQELLYIAVTSRAVVSSLISLDWVQDGISDDEAAAIDRINNIASAEVMSAVVALGWVRDGIDDDLEVKTIEELSYIANDDTGLGLAVVSLGWVQDGIGDTEAAAIDWFSNIAAAEVMSAVVALAWVRDGIDDDLEVKTIEELSYIANDDTGLGLAVVSLDWVQDGIGDTEAEAIDWIGNISDVDVASSVVALEWVRDGIDDDLEIEAIERLSYLTFRDVAAALRVVSMPFLRTIEPPDPPALASLSRLAASERDTFDRVMSNPALQEGITDYLVPIVATLRGVARTNPGLIDKLLDPTSVSLERRAITLPMAGDVDLAIIRTAPGAARSMDLLEHAVRGVEQFMGTPLPTNYVGLLYGNAVSGSFAGTNFGTHVAILSKYDIDDGSHEAQFAGSAIAHEVAHYYWSGNEDWADEGAAELVASIVDGARTGRPVGVTNSPCAYATTIAKLESLEDSRDDAEFGCNYSLGERLFVDLYHTLGDERFRQGFRALYLASELEDEDGDPGTSVRIEHVRAAFRSDDGAERAVIARWYDGSEPYDLSRLDDSPVDPSLPSINGRIDEAYIVTKTDGPAVSSFSARDVSDWVYLTLKHSYSVSGAREVQLEVVEYFEDGFEFGRHTSKLTVEPQYVGGTDWFSVGSPPSRKWAPGRYFVYVYADGRKVAEVEYEVIP